MSGSAGLPGGRRVLPGRGGGSGYVIPPGISLTGEPPLWVAVAWWGWLRESAFCREDIQRAFHVSEVSATSVMRYLLTRYAGLLQVSRIRVRQTGMRPRNCMLIGAPPPLDPDSRLTLLTALRRQTLMASEDAGTLPDEGALTPDRGL